MTFSPKFQLFDAYLEKFLWYRLLQQIQRETRVNNLVSMLDGFFMQEVQHINVNVFSIELLQDAMYHPEK